MRMLGWVAAVAALVVGAGSAQASTYFDTIAQGQYKTYVFTFDGPATSASPEALLSGHGLYSNAIYTPDGLFYDDFTDYPLPALCQGDGPCTKTSFAVAGLAYLSVYTLGDAYFVRVENHMQDYDICPTATGPASKMCRAHQAAVELSISLPGDNYSVTSTSGAVPEPATWAMMIAGFGLVGSTLRRRQRALA